MKRKILTNLAAGAGLLFLLPAAGALYYAGHLADSYYVRQGEALTLQTALPITAAPAEPATAAALTAARSDTVALRLFGMFPIKAVDVRQTQEVMLIPSGQPFGIRMLMDGIMVVGFGDVSGKDGSCCPALDAGLTAGDVITSANGAALSSAEDFRKAAADGAPMELTVVRDDTELTLSLTPAYAPATDSWQTGMWVRDSTAGIGTLTYYEPATGSFGGLGHPICDPDTGGLIPLASGEADAVTISGVLPGRPGIPGQLQGYFSAEEPIGTLSCNSACGIFGQLDTPPEGNAVPMALKQEVTLGEALLLTTVSGDTPKAYTVEITSIDFTEDTRNMLIRVTDEELLAASGGIVQGMSGSPILQDGRLVGAVTHVFVEEPAMGYGIFAERMYEYTQSTAAGSFA